MHGALTAQPNPQVPIPVQRSAAYLLLPLHIRREDKNRPPRLVAYYGRPVSAQSRPAG
eukprot:CAMPEP_0118937042 /NCGR_PEP_ID=MMETSP1169-20130426/21439_1 /TAXON_ID=36882 /ORGANISM="Pyramimonas obovata, Strain CCMP722" /LENGTH=57 /DNA_ID=CAMNT_0006880559 /DNA_START=61 /DNA_END=230 /DNA_ORIENTATION=-